MEFVKIRFEGACLGPQAVETSRSPLFIWRRILRAKIEMASRLVAIFQLARSSSLAKMRVAAA